MLSLILGDASYLWSCSSSETRAKWCSMFASDSAVVKVSSKSQLVPERYVLWL